MAEMSTQEQPQNPEQKQYTIGWISALPVELAAVVLDETYDKEYIDDYDLTYVKGKIDVHNVVIACLPSRGNVSAAAWATRLQSSFESLRCLLLVGIGGAVPTRHDIRLGDVVVGVPGKNHVVEGNRTFTRDHRGVVQYNFGTRNQDGEFIEIRRTQIPSPPAVLLTAIAALNAKYKQKPQVNALGQQLHEYAQGIAEKYPDLRATQRPETDVLFNTEFRHLDRHKTCEECSCDLSLVKERKARENPQFPRIHQGLIASGDEVVRDARERDRLSEKLDVLCFETEGAGANVGERGCLVIRGMCDYSDSHKNKDWQEYAAAVAAAYARELLIMLPGIKGSKDKMKKREEHPKVWQQTNIGGNVNVSGGGQSIIGGVYNNGNFTFNSSGS